MTRPAMTEARVIAEGLSELEADLLAGRCQGWGSWMWMVSSDLVGKGLIFDRSPTHRDLTPLGEKVRSILLQESGQ